MHPLIRTVVRRLPVRRVLVGAVLLGGGCVFVEPARADVAATQPAAIGAATPQELLQKLTDAMNQGRAEDVAACFDQSNADSKAYSDHVRRSVIWHSLKRDCIKKITDKYGAAKARELIGSEDEAWAKGPESTPKEGDSFAPLWDSNTKTSACTVVKKGDRFQLDGSHGLGGMAPDEVKETDDRFIKFDQRRRDAAELSTSADDLELRLKAIQLRE